MLFNQWLNDGNEFDEPKCQTDLNYKVSDKNMYSKLNKNLLNDLLSRQRELTKRLTLIECGETNYYIYDEKGIREIPVSYAIILAKYYEVTLDYLLEVSDSKS